MNWEKVSQLFDDALGCAPEDRLAFLRAAAGTTSEYEHALRLVRASELSTGFLTASPRANSSATLLESDDRVGEWRVLEPIGSGGMGDVYKVVRDTGDFEQISALKLIRNADADIEARFTVERQIAARLNHPNIARLIDGGKSDDGRLYMVVDFVKGRTVTAHAKEADLTEAARLKLFCDLCSAVGHAHSALVLHRDIKPDNVLVTDEGVLKLLDFGVASFLTGEKTEESAPLTVAYAAPEQLSGGAISTATDIYALGLLLRELLTGSRNRKASLLNADLQAIVEKCLKVEPGARYQSVEGLRNDIQRYLNSEPVSVREGGTYYRFKKLVNRYRVASASLGIAFAGLLAALLFSLMANERAQSALQLAEESSDLWEFEARTTRGLRRALLQFYGVESEAGDPIASKLVDNRLMNLSEEAEIAARLGDLQQAHDMFAIGGHFMRRFDHDAAIQVYERLLDTGVSDPLLRHQARSALAWSYENIGRDDEALTLAREVLRDPISRQQPFLQSTLEAERIVAKASDSLEARETLIEKFRAALREEENKPPEDRFFTGWYLNQLGVLYMRNGDIPKAAETFVEELRHGRALGVRSLEAVTTATNAAQGQVYVLREGAEPLGYLPDYLPYVNGEIGEDESREGFMHSIMGDAALLTGDWARADKEASMALQFLEGVYDYRGGWYFQVALTRIRALLAQDRLEEARALLTAFGFGKTHHNKAVAANATCMNHFAQALILAKTGQTSGAREQYNLGLAACGGGGERPLRAPFQFHADAVEAAI